MGGDALEDLRRRIDGVDGEILRLLDERMRICEEIALAKSRLGRRVFDPRREELVLERAGEHASIYEAIIRECRRRQERLLSTRDSLEEPDASSLFELYTRVKPTIRLDAGDPDLPPPKSLLEALAARILGRGLHYTLPGGSPGAREALASHYGVGLDSAIVTAGVKPVIAALVHALRGSLVVLAPYYPGYVGVARLFGKRITILPTVFEEGFQPDPEALYHMVGRGDLLIVNSPNNPAGTVYRESIWKILPDIAADNKAWILSDEAYQELDWTGETPILALRHEENIVSAHTLSKLYSLPGLRAGYALGDPSLLRIIERFQATTITCPNTLAETAVTEALPLAAERKRIVHAILKERTHAILEALDPNHWETREPRGGLYVFPRNKHGIPGGEIAKKLLEEHGISVFPGTLYGTRYREHIRISLTAPPDKLKLAGQALNQTIEEMTRE